jgi:hypothetical protein
MTWCVLADMIPCTRSFCTDRTVNVCAPSGFVSDRWDCADAFRCEDGNCVNTPDSHTDPR